MKKNSQILIGIIAGLLILLFLSIIVLAASLIMSKSAKTKATSAETMVVVEIPTVSASTQMPPSPTSTPLPAPTAQKQPTAKPTSTPMPTVKPQNTSTSQPAETKPQAIVTANIANLRAGPSVAYKIVTQAPKGTKFTIVARDKTDKWWGVLLESGDIVWIYKDLVEVQGDTSKVPELIIPEAGSATATPTPRPSETPTPSAAAISGKLAFAVFDPTRGTYDVYVLDMSTKGTRRVIDYASEPSLSPDGARIAFRRWKSDDRGIEVMNTYGGNRRRLTNFFEDGLPAWSPDGKTLVFFSRRESDRRSRIYMLDVNGAHDWVLRRGPDAVYGEFPTWTPSGRVVYRATVPQIGLGIMNNDGSGFSMILGDGDATAPAVSPDGKRIAFMSRRDGNWEVYVVGIDGSGLKRLTFNGANDGLPTWSPDGKTIAFVSNRNGHWSIWLMNPDGSNQREFYVLPGSIDGHVKGEPDYASRGWVEERISWSR